MDRGTCETGAPVSALQEMMMKQDTRHTDSVCEVQPSQTPHQRDKILVDQI